MNLEFFKPAAKEEFFDAIAWYERESPGLGKEIADEVIQLFEHAQSQPEVLRKVRGRARKIHLKRFKDYSIYFAIKDDAFSVISVFHGARNPAELRRRLK
ncbi:MAG: type II toxin-antitoxin system RelE/ParE family toxin [Verrucomicrobiota bacterium]